MPDSPSQRAASEDTLGHYRAIVDNSDDAILGLSLDGRVWSWNAAAERLFGWTATEMRGQSLHRLLPPDRQGEEAAALARLHAGLRVERLHTERLHKDGHRVDVSVTVSPVTNGAGQLIGVGQIVRDIGEQLQAQRSIWLQTHFDPLTQLPNRRRLMDELDAALNRARQSGSEVALLLIDLDRFKQINDALGHAAGDALLVEVSTRIRACVRAGDLVSHLGGDEFVVLLPSLQDHAEVAAVASRISAQLSEPVALRRDWAQVSCSIGYVIHPTDGASASELFANADMAMYESKRLGRNRSLRFDPALQVAGRRRSRLSADLHHAAERQQLHLVYQPVFELLSGRIAKCEALLRWNHPEFGPVNPAEFIPLAEDSGVIHAMGDWVFRTAAQQLAEWRQINPTLQMAVNVSVLQLRASDGRIEGWPAFLQALGLPRQAMVAEITESVMVEGSGATESSLRALRGAGIEVAVDDFGIGFSCLASLDRLDVNCLKIDASFTRKLSPGARVIALCQAITAMAHALGLEVVVEGVETEAQLKLLRDIGCDMVQGYLLSRPVSPEVLTALLRKPGGPVAA